MHNPHWRLAAAISASVLLTLATGCGPSETKEQQIAAAKAALAKNDRRTAIVQLKNALQQDPKSAEARFLLGDTLLKSGDYAGAAQELARAAELKHDPNALLPSLVKSMVATGQAKKAVELYGNTKLTDPRAAAELNVALATAYAAQGMREPSQASVKTALQLDPGNTTARLLDARAAAQRKDFDGALKLVRGVIADDAKNREALQFQGELLWSGKADWEGAIQSFRQTLAVDPKYLPAHAAILAIYLQRRDVNGFKSQFAELKKALPDHAETRFYEAQVALAEEDYKRAREISQQLLRVGPDSPRLLQLAGAIEAAGGSPALAEAHLAKALQLAPGLLFARRLLAETYNRSGQPDRALTTLRPLLEQAHPPAEALALAAESNLLLGEPLKAEALFAEAAKANPSDSKVQTALALTQIAKGNYSNGFAQLETVAAHDPTTFADLALIGARLRRNELDAALQAVDKLQAKVPNRPSAYHLRGRILMQRKDWAGARAAFEKALSVDPAFFPAVADLANIDLVENKPDQARKRFEDVLAREPQNMRALVSLVTLRTRTGAPPAEIEAMLQNAIRQNATELAPRVLLVDHLLAQGNSKAAVTVAQEAVAALRDNPIALSALGRAELANGDTQQAISTYGRLVAAQPKSTQTLLALADAYVSAKDTPAATRTLYKALEIYPGLLEAHRRLLALALADKRMDQALDIARTVQKQHPKAPAGYLFESEVLAKQQKWQPALAAAKAALERQRVTDIALKVYTLQLMAGQTAEAERFAADWLKQQPQDATFLASMGAVAIEKRDYAAAEKHYRAVVGLRADDASALNNLAWLLLQQGKPGAAEFAARANQLTPNRPAVMDTLAGALLQENKLSQAIEWQRKAVDAAPNVPGYRLNLAKSLLKSGDKTAARAELEKLAKLGDKFGGQGEVEALLKSI